MNKLSEYEIKRLKRIEENKSKIKELFPDGKIKLLLPSFQSNNKIKTPENIDKQYTPKSRSASRRRLQYGVRCNPTRKARPRAYSETIRRPLTRSQKRRLSEGSDDSASNSSDEEKCTYSHYSPKRRRIRSDTEALPIQLDEKDVNLNLDLTKVAERNCRKIYDKVNGTTCHQCRQKTRDLKTTCHNENCNGVRGQFCGICLKNRYGEDVKEALLDKTWVCPPCRGVCNCSFCLPRKGMAPTGIMIHIAKECGYDNVKDYLENHP